MKPIAQYVLGLPVQDAEGQDSDSIEEELVSGDEDDDENAGGSISKGTGADCPPSTTQGSPGNTENAETKLEEKTLPLDETHDDASSTSSLANRANELDLYSDSPPHPSGSRQNIREVVAAQVSKSRTRNQVKHHSRKGPTQAGRAKGSKAKQDIRHKMDVGGIWD